MPIKVAFIGAGSIGFTRGLFRDLLAMPELTDTRFAFTDISERNMDMVTQLCRKDIREVAKSDVLFLNYANPNAMNTWAANHFGKVNTIGLCHGLLLYGADGPGKVWVNGEAVDARHNAANPATPGEYRVKVSWKKGRNDVLFALATNLGRAWGLYAGASQVE